jgi:hypothetical protein
MGVLRIPVLPVQNRRPGAGVPAGRAVAAPQQTTPAGRQSHTRLSDEDLERWLVEWIPAERDRLMAEYDAAAATWGSYTNKPGVHPADVWLAELLLDDAREELAAHDRFAAWAKGWLTRRWQGRMGALVELW